MSNKEPATGSGENVPPEKSGAFRGGCLAAGMDPDGRGEIGSTIRPSARTAAGEAEHSDAQRKARK